MERAGGKPQTGILVGQQRRCLGAEFEGFAVRGFEQAACSLAAQPLLQPPRVQAGIGSKLASRDPPGPAKRPVQAKLVAEMDHQRNDLALLVAPYPQGHPDQLVGIGHGSFRLGCAAAGSPAFLLRADLSSVMTPLSALSQDRPSPVQVRPHLGDQPGWRQVH